jgi:hypothetical protein
MILNIFKVLLFVLVGLVIQTYSKPLSRRGFKSANGTSVDVSEGVMVDSGYGTRANVNSKDGVKVESGIGYDVDVGQKGVIVKGAFIPQVNIPGIVSLGSK